ncbi:MAG: DUF1223 domain-containing protein [Acidobacteria bacterium]|nr:DUF1223 domain-containing protein [Acidobacteriota bacterium]
MRPTRTSAGIAVVVALAAAGGAAPGPVPPAPDDPAPGSPAPVIVELFTSQGCSSCPPADELLRGLARNQPVPGATVIPLSEHVDYWDRLGWRDPFSSPRFTARQKAYAAALDAASIYTPQVVVDGQAGLVGSRGVEVRAAILEARDRPKVPVRVGVDSHPRSRVVEVTAEVGPDRLAAAAEAIGAWLAITESGLETDVRAGENRFRRLHHTGVVRHLERLDTLTAQAAAAGRSVRARLRLDAAWTRERLHAVVFLQERESLRIVGAARAAVAGPPAAKLPRNPAGAP